MAAGRRAGGGQGGTGSAGLHADRLGAGPTKVGRLAGPVARPAGRAARAGGQAAERQRDRRHAAPGDTGGGGLDGRAHGPGPDRCFGRGRPAARPRGVGVLARSGLALALWRPRRAWRSSWATGGGRQRYPGTTARLTATSMHNEGPARLLVLFRVGEVSWAGGMIGTPTCA